MATCDFGSPALRNAVVVAVVQPSIPSCAARTSSLCDSGLPESQERSADLESVDAVANRACAVAVEIQ